MNVYDTIDADQVEIGDYIENVNDTDDAFEVLDKRDDGTVIVLIVDSLKWNERDILYYVPDHQVNLLYSDD